jgi:holo-[acyl-carrier protein] synthase
MIYGIGTDILRIERVRLAVERHGARFAQRILGPQELAIYERRNARVAARGLRFLATRFAAKEAISKALGLGMRMPMTWRSAEILKAPSGAPFVLAHGALAEWLGARGLSVKVSLTDEEEYAVAFAIAEKKEE